MNTTATPEDLDAYTITSRREILFYLRQLINDSEHVNVMCNEGRDSLLTLLLDVDEDENLLYFDWGGSEETNARILTSRRCIFVATPLGVRNQFVGDTPREVMYQNRRAFVTTLPEKYVRLQRREFFRMQLPMTRRPTCRIKLPTQTAELPLSVFDISLGGIRLEAQEPSLPLEIGQVLQQAVIDFNGSVMRTDLNVSYIGGVTRGTKQVTHLGCGFVKLSAGQENEIQKFMTQIQREERAKLG